jgi:hypothetical protein
MTPSLQTAHVELEQFWQWIYLPVRQDRHEILRSGDTPRKQGWWKE